LEHLRCLLCKIGLANEFAISIKCSLAGDENDVSAANFRTQPANSLVGRQVRVDLSA
jgi:hypothetical protein